MNATRKIRLDRIASSTFNARLEHDVVIGPEIVAREGYVLAVRLLNDKTTYHHLENCSGRLIRLHRGDVIAGTLGTRRALRGYAGTIPETIAPGDTIHLLNLGGVLGRCTSANPEIGPPFDAEVLGAVLSFPRVGDRIGAPAHVRSGAVSPAKTIHSHIPIVFVAGTSMNSGKTVAASEIVRGLRRAGRRVAGMKLTGVSLRRDALSMIDAGAIDARTFTDAGIVSTHDSDVLPAARGVINFLGEKVKPDVIVAELGDGILGEYGVATLLANPEVMDLAEALVVCAPDQVGAWGAVHLLEQRFALRPTLITGPVTDNEVGCSFIESHLDLPAINARRFPERLAARIEEVLRDDA